LAVTVSAGVATTCGDAAATPAGLLWVADGRLYEAKRDGRNRVVGDGDIATVSIRAARG
jgi:PleD family two-component response regulator